MSKLIGKLKYKKVSSIYWETADSLSFVIDELTKYDIKYIDVNDNSVTEVIEIFRTEQDDGTGSENIITYNVIINNNVI